MKTVAIINPASAGGATFKRLSCILSALRNKIARLEYRVTEEPNHATVLARDALLDGATLIVSVGGDGTNNEIVNGFFENGYPINKNAVMALLPAGRGCDFARAIGIPRDTDAAVDVIVNGEPKQCDLGNAVFLDHEGNTVQRLFLNVVDIGIGGETANRVHSLNRSCRPLVAYLSSFMLSLLSYKNKPITAVIDRIDLGEFHAKAVVVANGTHCGSGMLVTPDAAVDDGFFDALLVGDVSVWVVIRHLRDLYTGKPILHPRVHRAKVKRLSVSSAERVLIDLDGEPVGTLPASFNILPAAIKILTPSIGCRTARAI